MRRFFSRAVRGCLSDRIHYWVHLSERCLYYYYWNLVTYLVQVRYLVGVVSGRMGMDREMKGEIRHFYSLEIQLSLFHFDVLILCTTVLIYVT